MGSERKRRKVLVQSLEVLFFFASGAALVGGELFGSLSKVNQSARILLDFSNLVQAYVTVHKQQESLLLPLKQTIEPAKIAEHQQLLASKIRSTRAHAVEGQIFTLEVRKALLPIIRRHFRGPYAGPSHLTIKQGNPVKMRLHINEVYPEGVPWTTVPPSLLQNLPHLPQEVEYRIVGRDLILWDVKANLVVDIFRLAIP